jgi:hypothetical protein
MRSEWGHSITYGAEFFTECCDAIRGRLGPSDTAMLFFEKKTRLMTKGISTSDGVNSNCEAVQLLLDDQLDALGTYVHCHQTGMFYAIDVQ